MDSLERATQRPANLDSLQVVDRGSPFRPSSPVVPATSLGSSYIRGAMPGNMVSTEDIRRQTLSPATRQTRPLLSLGQAADIQAPPSASVAASASRQQTSGLTLNDIANTPQYVKMPASFLSSDGTLNLDALKASIAGDSPAPQVTLADLNELKATIASLDVPRSYQSDIDQLNALFASQDTPRGTGFESWTNWTATITASGAMTVTGPSVVYSQFVRVGAFVFYMIQANFTLGGTASTAVLCTLPVTPVGAGNYSVNTNIINGGAVPWIPSFGFVDVTNNRLNFATPTAANWTLGGAWFSSQGFYRI